MAGQNSIVKVGHAPDYAVSDGGHNLKGGLGLAGIPHHLDVSHTLGYIEMANIEALTAGESMGCRDACIEWSGNSGGGIACDCARYVGKCKRRCA